MSINLSKLPKNPGVYIFKDQNGRILYVGKANNLKSRVGSYFNKGTDLSVMKQVMVRQIADIEIKETRNEAKALIWEDKFIKKYKPPYNVRGKDDKHYLYIKISEEDFPQVDFVRRPNFRQKAKYYGPFPWSRPVKQVYKYLHKIFPLRTCKTMPKKECLEFHMGRCMAPCVSGLTKTEYQKIIDKVVDFFEGRDEELIEEADKKMKASAKKKDFEKAVYYRDQLFAMRKLQELKLTALQIQKRSEKEFTRKGLLQIKQKLNLPRIPKRVEVYDISNIQGKYAVGSMVVFNNGVPDKSQYRKFKIKTVQGANDTASLKEVVTRRAKHDEWARPDLVIMDGGKGQLNAVKDIWKSIDVKVCALAKREEEIYLPNIKSPKKFVEGTEGYYLMQKMRDEAHRFAIAYHRQLRIKGLTK